MAAKPVCVSYQAVPGPGDWDRIRPDIERQLPLKNLHWKSGNRSIRTIQALSLDFRPLSSFGDEQPPLTLLERPYLHLLFVVCDDNEVYRTTVRSQIRDWVDSVVAKHKQEWLIVVVTSGRIAGAKFYQRKGSVVDKIRADFNTGKRDRCVQVAQSVPAEDPTTWAEFTIKVKEGIISAFDTNVALYEEDVKKADSQRQLEGWQYCTFFLQKEGLANSFEAMTLLEDALIQYDELEASFFQTLKENNGAWFGDIGGLSVGDDALPLLSTNNKPYRKLISANTISIFDFRIYLFARQAALLTKLGRIADVAKRGAYFISTFARTLRDNQDTLGRNFVESWTYSACLNVVDECQRWADDPSTDTAVVQGFVAVKAELLELARKQLDKIGIAAGHLPLAHPFSMSLNETTPKSSSSSSSTVADRPPVSRSDLLSAIGKRDVFDKLYIDLTNRSIQAYQSSRRKRCSLKLHASLAALEDHRERPTSAQKLYSHLPAHYVDLRWVKIESSLLSQCTRLQGRLDMPKERLLSTLALVRAGIEYGSKVWRLEPVGEGDPESGERLAKHLMDDVYSLSSGLAKDFAAIAFPTFSMRLGSDRGSSSLDEDGVTVSLIIKSLLPCTIKVDEVRLKFSTAEGEQIWFTSGGCSLPPGETEAILFCPTAISGRLALELSQIRFSRIIFQYSHRPISSRNLAPDPRNAPSASTTKQPVVHFARDRQALDAYLELPRAMDLEQNRQAILCVATGRNQLIKVSLTLTTASADVTFGIETAEMILGTAKLGPLVAGGPLLLEDLQAASVIKIQLPILGILRDPAIEVTISADYFTSKRPNTRRTLRRAISHPAALPLSVNVQDFFRKDCLLSKFSVTTDGLRGLRIKSASLEGTGGISIKPCRNPSSPIITILPLQVVNFLFKITKAHTSTTAPPTLRLVLTYCSIQDDLVERVKDATSKALVDRCSIDDEQWLSDAVVSEVIATTNLRRYGVSSRLDDLAFDEVKWIAKAQAQFHDASRCAGALESVRTAYEILKSTPFSDSAAAWRTLAIPVDVPSLSILNLVHISPASTRTEVGQALPVVLSIRPTFSWASSPLNSPQDLTYDVSASLYDWLVSGRKQGELVAQDGVETKVHLTLIPLRPGALFLPSVSIRPLVSADSVLTCETQHINAATSIEVLPVSGRTTFSVGLDNFGGERESLIA